MSKITILGAGSWGTALATVLAVNNHQIKIWDRDSEKVKAINKNRINPKFPVTDVLANNITATDDLAIAVSDAEYILNSVPTQFLRSVLEQMPQLSKEIVIINAAKGLEIGTEKRISQVVTEFYPENAYAVISGPSHAEEVAKKMPTTLVAACEDKEIAFAVQDLFITPYIRVYAHKDVLGIELAGALKNVIAIAAGIASGLGYGDNALAALMTRGIIEIKRLGFAMGALPETFDGLAGIGDLIVTCMSQHSRNRRCGQYLASGMSLDEAIAKVGQAVEGAYTIKAAEVLRLEMAVEMPIVEQLYSVLYQGASAQEAVYTLMSRAKKHELDESFTISL